MHRNDALVIHYTLSFQVCVSKRIDFQSNLAKYKHTVKDISVYRKKEVSVALYIFKPRLK